MVPGESRCSSAGEPGGRTSLRASSPFDEDDLSDASTLRVTCRALLTGHAEDVQEILWRPAEELVCVRCSALSERGECVVCVWQLASGRLERVVRGVAVSAHVLAMARAPLCQGVVDVTSFRDLRTAATKRALDGVAVTLGSGTSPLSVMVFHVKQLSSDAKQGALLREGHTYEGSPSLNAADSPAMPACQWALAYLMCWGVDLPFDEQCRSLLDLSEPLPQVICGVRGHSGLLSFLTPGAHHALGHHRAHLGMQYHRWRSSAHLTALHSIAAVALSNALMMCPGNDDLRNVCSGLVTHFSVVIPERLPGFCAPSLSLLARHYIDAVEYVQQSARSLMEGTLQRMSVEVRRQIIHAWAPRVLRLSSSVAEARPPDLASPQGVSVSPRSPLRARRLRTFPRPDPRAARAQVLVLAVLASRFSASVDSDVCEVIVRTLLALLNHPAELHRASAAELLGTGYPAWRAHLSPPALIRALFRLSVLHARDTAGDAGAGAASGAADSAPPSPFFSALLSVGMLETHAFCHAMGALAVHMEAAHADRVMAVSALISLVKARGSSLEAELPIVVEAVMKPLDPSVPSLREGLLAASTTALRELVKRYPMMTFHQETQRLAVGTSDGVVLIYDLRTATKWRIFQAGCLRTRLCPARRPSRWPVDPAMAPPAEPGARWSHFGRRLLGSRRCSRVIVGP